MPKQVWDGEKAIVVYLTDKYVAVPPTTTNCWDYATPVKATPSNRDRLWLLIDRVIAGIITIGVWKLLSR